MTETRTVRRACSFSALIARRAAHERSGQQVGRSSLRSGNVRTANRVSGGAIGGEKQIELRGNRLQAAAGGEARVDRAQRRGEVSVDRGAGPVGRSDPSQLAGVPRLSGFDFSVGA